MPPTKYSAWTPWLSAWASWTLLDAVEKTEAMEKNIKLLIVDDIEHNIIALEALLASPRVTVLKARSGPEALEILLQHEVALAILDVNMPGMDGFELAELMRGTTRTRSVPIIFLTASAHDASRTFKGYEAGAVDFLYKPFDTRILASKVEVFVRLEQQKQQLAEQLATMQQLLEANEMFMAVLGHDLRTPLSAVMASSEVLLFLAKEDKSRAAAGRIKSSATRMTRMVDQLLNLARLQGGRLHVEPVGLDLHALAVFIADECRARRPDRELHLEAEGDCQLEGDENLLSQIVSNLIGNALQHGTPEVPVSVRIDGRDAQWIELGVRNGGTIPETLRAHIFEPFRGSQRGTRESDGLGLGLHIAREFARMHGGDIRLETNTDAGTRFLVRLPRRQGA
ncbi:hybrid sensor histidine kinase/response regulator [Niveibacterium sp. SC-1]|uniref:hybrid sensor histidine kinase/response regulator n=1 Tax=Niveibacterium sp. SC-1 TaxID=3135646 RepID=UPI00311ECBC7